MYVLYVSTCTHDAHDRKTKRCTRKASNKPCGSRNLGKYPSPRHLVYTPGHSFGKSPKWHHGAGGELRHIYGATHRCLFNHGNVVGSGNIKRFMSCCVTCVCHRFKSQETWQRVLVASLHVPMSSLGNTALHRTQSEFTTSAPEDPQK